MDRKIFENHYLECLDKNHESFLKYFDYRYKTFHELTTTVFEITHCLQLEFNKAAITLTNHFLERLLKLSLIKNDVGIGPVPIDSWNEVFELPTQKYTSISLGKSIDLCEKYNLINQKEKDILYNIFRDQIRNGFSHADGNKILNDFPDIMSGYYGAFDGSDKMRKVNLNQKNIPSIQSVLIDNFAKENALSYFDFIFRLMMNIEERLKTKN